MQLFLYKILHYKLLFLSLKTAVLGLKDPITWNYASLYTKIDRALGGTTEKNDSNQKLSLSCRVESLFEA